MPVGFVGIVICPGTTVPVGTKQNARGEFRTILCHDISRFQCSAVIACQVYMLLSDFAAILSELLHNPLPTFLVAFCIHGTRTEVALCLTEGKGRVGIEGRSNWIYLLQFVHVFGFRCAGDCFNSIPSISDGGNEQGCNADSDHILLHFRILLIISSPSKEGGFSG